MPGKNSTDIALVIDVVLAVCSGSVDAFCIVSSDADYTRLALLIREKGKRVLVIGKSTTPPSLRSECSEFINLDDLRSPPAQVAILKGRQLSPAPNKAEKSTVAGDSVQSGAGVTRQLDCLTEPTCTIPPPQQLKPADLIPLIRELTGDWGKTTLKAIHAECSRRYANFSPRRCGARKWITQLQKVEVLRIDPIRDKKTGQIKDYAVSFRLAVQIPGDLNNWCDRLCFHSRSRAPSGQSVTRKTHA